MVDRYYGFVVWTAACGECVCSRLVIKLIKVKEQRFDMYVFGNRNICIMSVDLVFGKALTRGAKIELLWCWFL